MTKKVFFAFLVGVPFLLNCNAFAQERSIFTAVDQASDAVRSAERLREPYAQALRESKTQRDYVANHAPFPCDSHDFDYAKRCEDYRDAQKSADDSAFAKQVLLDRADKIVEEAKAAKLEAQIRLADAKLSSEQPDPAKLKRLLELQNYYFFQKSALQTYDDNQKNKSAFDRLFSSMKDKVVDHERDTILGKIAEARNDYLDELRSQESIVKLETSTQDLAVRLPEISDAAVHTQDRSECINPQAEDSRANQAFAYIRSFGQDLVDTVKGRTRHSDPSRCGSETSSGTAKVLPPVEEASWTPVGAQPSERVSNAK